MNCVDCGLLFMHYSLWTMICWLLGVVCELRTVTCGLRTTISWSNTNRFSYLPLFCKPSNEWSHTYSCISATKDRHVEPRAQWVDQWISQSLVWDVYLQQICWCPFLDWDLWCAKHDHLQARDDSRERWELMDLWVDVVFSLDFLFKCHGVQLSSPSKEKIRKALPTVNEDNLSRQYEHWVISCKCL